MTRSLLLAVLTYAALLVDASGVVASSSSHFTPRLLPLMVIAALVLIDSWRAIVWAAVAGLLADALAPGPLGVEMLCATAIAWTIRRMTRLAPGEAAWLIALAGTPALFLEQTSATLLRAFLEQRPVALAEAVGTAGQIAVSGMAVLLGIIVLYRTLTRLNPRHLLFRVTTSAIR